VVERITGHGRQDHRFTDCPPAVTKEQVHYAVSDVTHLRDVSSAGRRPQERGRNDWVSEEMEVLTSPRPTTSIPSRLGAAQTRCANEELAVLMEIAPGAKQERRAATCAQPRLKDDRSRYRHAPPPAWNGCRPRSWPKGFDRSKWGADVVAAVQRGLARDPGHCRRSEAAQQFECAAIVEL